MTQKKLSLSGTNFIVKKIGSNSAVGAVFKSLTGVYYLKSDLRFLDVLEEKVSYDLFVQLLNLDDHVGSLGYHIVELI